MSPLSLHDSHERLAFLARMTSLFASGRDLDATLAGVVDLFVPGFADGAAIDLLREGVLERVASATVLGDPGHDPRFAEIRRTAQSLQHAEVRRLLAEGEVRIVNIASAADYPWPPASAEYEALFATMFPLSVIFAPLQAHGETLGLMQMVTVRGTRTYTAEDAAIVGDVAQRAAFAIHNARLVLDLTRELESSGRALQRLEESERLHRSMFEGNPLPLWLFDRETLRFVDVNPAAVEHYGYSRDEFLAMTILDIRPPGDIPRVHAALRNVGPGVHHPGTFLHRRKDGSLIVVDIHAHDVEVRGRRCRMVQAIDVTERVRALDSLRMAEERHRILTRVTKEAIWEWNAGTDRIEWSPTVHDLFHLPPGAVDGSREWFRARVHPDDIALLDERMQQVYASDSGTGALRFRFLRGDGAWATVESRMVISRQDGEVARITGALADVTHEQHVSEQLALAQRMEAVGRLAGGVAHDFNNLLTAIRGFASFALDDQLPSSRARDDIEQILQAADRAAALTRQLLAFSRRQVLQPQLVHVNEILHNLQKMLARVLGEDIEVVTALTPDPWPVLVDPGQLEQVIMNLVVNARDAMPQGGVLTIATSNVTLDAADVDAQLGAHEGDHVLIAITDTGIGMDARTMEQIFEPFFSTKERDKGTGLGLATSYGIIQQSGGHIGVISALDRGSTFNVYLPRADDDEPTTVRPSTEPSASVDGHETLLVVEDDDRVRRVSVAALRRHGYRVLEARTAEAALALFNEQHGSIDMVVSDVVLPRRSGPSLSQELRALRPDLRLLFVSGYTENAFLAGGAMPPGIELLEKPFTPEALVRRVRAILDRPGDG